MVSRDYYREYYKKHRDVIRAQSRERVARWRKKHIEEYHKRRRKTLLYYVNLYYINSYGKTLNTSNLPSNVQKYLNKPFREIVKGKEEREFLNFSNYSLRKKEDKPKIAYDLLNRFANSKINFNINDKNEKEISVIKSLVKEADEGLGLVETIKTFKEKLRLIIKEELPTASEEEASKIFNKYSKEYEKILNRSFKFVEENYKKDNGYYLCPFSDCNAKSKRLEKLKWHYFIRHGPTMAFMLYLFEDIIRLRLQ